VRERWYICTKREKEEIKGIRRNGYTGMSTKEELMNEIQEAPEPLLSEVLDFVHFLKGRRLRERFETAVMSESSLGKDWLDREEDDAWQSL
jgi:hypothetical protein